MNAEVPEMKSWLWLAMLIAVAMHGAFVALIQPQTLRAQLQAVDLPDLTFWFQSSGETRALYSPVLFALPTPMGFSASMLNQPLQSDPPMKEQAAALNMLQVDQRLVESSSRPVFTQDRFRIENVFTALPAYTFSPQDQASAKSGGLSVRYEGTTAFRNRAPIEVTDVPNGGTVSWLAAFFVDLEEDGRVRRVLTEVSPERGPGKDVLIRWLYQQTFEPGLPASGRVALRWTPASEGGAL